MQLPINTYFDNFTYSCADTALYGLVRSNYYSPVVPFPLDSSTVRLGKINPTTGVVTILSSAALFGEGYSLNAGSAIDPNTMTYYYNTGAFLVGASLYNGQQNSIDSIQFADGSYFDLIRNFDNCLAINIIRTNNSTGISEINQDIISIAPNPASSEISIKSEEMFSQINIYSTQGNIVFTEQLNANESTISINELNEGLYIVQIRLSNGKTINKRIIKQ
jgi:hypothetical protein